MRTGIEIEHMPYLLKRFRTLDFVERPAKMFIRDWADAVKEEIEDNMPVGVTGDAKESFRIEVGPGKIPRWGRVVSDSPVVRWIEYGTGELSEDPESAGQAYMPPPNRLRSWADSKGLDPVAVAVGIRQRGGTPARHIVSEAMDEINSRIGERVENLGEMIEYEASR